MLTDLISKVSPYFNQKKVRTTGFVFKCLTRITVNLLLASILVISMKQYFGYEFLVFRLRRAVVNILS